MSSKKQLFIDSCFCIVLFFMLFFDNLIHLAVSVINRYHRVGCDAGGSYRGAAVGAVCVAAVGDFVTGPVAGGRGVHQIDIFISRNAYRTGTLAQYGDIHIAAALLCNGNAVIDGEIAGV